MKRTVVAAAVVVAIVASLGLSGCSSSTSTEQPDPNTQADGDEHSEHEDGEHEHGEHEHDGEGGQSDMEKMKAELAKLPPEDAASVEKQHFCPVSDEMLGTMGAPQKVAVNGQQVWICCDGCKDKLLANPEEYLAKLKKE